MQTNNHFIQCYWTVDTKSIPRRYGIRMVFPSNSNLSRRPDRQRNVVRQAAMNRMSQLIVRIKRHISTGSGRGNPYGLAAVTAVCFPVFFFGRLYFPASPMTLTIFFVTTVLVVGYSWQDTHFPTLSNAGKSVYFILEPVSNGCGLKGWGLSVAWVSIASLRVRSTIETFLS